MICKKCLNSGVLNSAAGKNFYYCRTCKSEIELESVEHELGENVMLDDLFKLEIEEGIGINDTDGLGSAVVFDPLTTGSGVYSPAVDFWSGSVSSHLNSSYGMVRTSKMPVYVDSRSFKSDLGEEIEDTFISKLDSCI